MHPLGENAIPYFLSAVEEQDLLQILLFECLVVSVHPGAKEGCYVPISVHSMGDLFLLSLELVGSQELVPVHEHADLELFCSGTLEEHLNFSAMAIFLGKGPHHTKYANKFG